MKIETIQQANSLLQDIKKLTATLEDVKTLCARSSRGYLITIEVSYRGGYTGCLDYKLSRETREAIRAKKQEFYDLIISDLAQQIERLNAELEVL